MAPDMEISEVARRTKPRVLVIDDEERVLRLVVEVFRLAGFEARGVHSAGEALLEVEKLSPDIVITDVDMPDMDGSELAVVLRSRAMTREVPIIFLSGKCSDDDRELGSFCGGSAYIGKPFAMGGLLRTVRRLLARKGLAVHSLS